MIGSHQKPVRGATNEWLTPRYIIDAFPAFDLDPCSPRVRPFDTAKEHFTIDDDGLSKVWHGNVWLNPPYGDEITTWMWRLSQHGRG